MVIEIWSNDNSEPTSILAGGSTAALVSLLLALATVEMPWMLFQQYFNPYLNILCFPSIVFFMILHTSRSLGWPLSGFPNYFSFLKKSLIVSHIEVNPELLPERRQMFLNRFFLLRVFQDC